MCELLALSSRCATKLTLSFARLSSHSAGDASSRDGWGVAYYQDHDVALHREPRAASDSALARLLESGGPCTSLAVAHIRHATLGDVRLANTQPFVRELAGQTHVFAHNGHLPGITLDSATRFRPVGSTDSEVAFCNLLGRLREAYGPDDALPPLEQRLHAVAAFAAELRGLGPANFIYADGDAVFAHAHRRIQHPGGRIAPPGLHWLSRRCTAPGRALEGCGLCVGAGFQQVTLVASVPLSDDAWQPLAEGEVVAIAAGEPVASARP